MLNSFLQERFMMAELVHNANIEIERAHETSEKRLDALRRYKKDRGVFEGYMRRVGEIYSSLGEDARAQLGPLNDLVTEFSTYSHVESNNQHLQVLGELVINDGRIESLLREKQEEINRLRDIVVNSGISLSSGLGISGGKLGGNTGVNASAEALERVRVLEQENSLLKANLRSLEARLSGE
jgi:hypothetical protein